MSGEDDEAEVVPFPTSTDAFASPEAPDLAPEDLDAAVEALLFAAGEPVTVAELADALGVIDPDAVREALHRLAQARVGSGIRLVKVAGGWQLRTDPRFADAVLRLRGGRPQVMSKAALETLAVVAYRQPVTRAECDEIRGVNSGGTLKTLLDKGYLRVVGRRDEPGRPLEYGTTPLFLEMFELSGLDGLPTLKEREELAIQQEDPPTLEAPEVAVSGFVDLPPDALPEAGVDVPELPEA